jgi:hypothetical protein
MQEIGTSSTHDLRGCDRFRAVLLSKPVVAAKITVSKNAVLFATSRTRALHPRMVYRPGRATGD